MKLKLFQSQMPSQTGIRIFFLFLGILWLGSASLLSEQVPVLVHVGEIRTESDLSPSFLQNVKDLLRHSIRNSAPQMYLVIDEDSARSNSEHIQKNTKRQTCQVSLCEKWLEENLEPELRISGTIESVQNQMRITLRLQNLSTKKILQSKEGIFPDSQFEFYTSEMVKTMFLRGYEPQKPPVESNLHFSFPEISIQSKNPDLRIFTPPTDSEKINELLKTLEKKVLRGDAKFREGDYETALTIYMYVSDKLLQSLNYIEQRSITEYEESITERKTAALLRNIEKNIKEIDRKVRLDKQDADKLLDYLQTYNSMLKDFHSNEIKDPEVMDGLLSRISKLEFMVVNSFEKRAEQHEYYGRYPEAIKDYEKLTKIIQSNSNMKNLSSYLKKIEKKIEKNRKLNIEFASNSMKTLYYIAEKESFNRVLKQNIGDTLAAQGAEDQMKYCLDRGDLILAKNPSDNEVAYKYYVKIQNLFNAKQTPTFVSVVPKRTSIYFIDYSKLWYSIYFPGLGQRFTLPDEKNSSTIFYAGIVTFAHVLYRASAYSSARSAYESTERLDPLILTRLDTSSRNFIFNSENTAFDSLRDNMDTTQQNLNVSLGLFGLVYMISLGDAAYTYYKGTKLSVHHPFSFPIGNGSMDLKINYNPLDSRSGMSYMPGEVKYGFQYTQSF
jgi:tetratricopeptide (TPR) repeat protein